MILRVATSLLAIGTLVGMVRAQASAERCGVLVQNAAHGVRIGGAASYVESGRWLAASLPAGQWQLRFGAGDGARPAELAVQAPADGEVVVATGSAQQIATPPVLHVSEPFAKAMLFGDEASRDVRVRVRMRASKSQGAAGLVARWQDDEHGYRLVWDAAATELRLERLLGGKPWVIGRTKAPASDDSWHVLELEVQGFGLAAYCDDVRLWSELDGALTSGRFGTMVSEGAALQMERLESSAPCVVVPTLAAVRDRGTVTVTARAPQLAGSVYCLSLRLDRPVPAIPQSLLGFECFVMQRPALPVFLCGFSFGTVGPRGEIEGSVAWPESKLLRYQACLIGGMLGTPDEEHASGWLPWAAVRW